ncbi:MAG: hypothetical protein CMD26_02250, partial [Flavobacteriales bacterium]|nr:hypothetical protein [Flavobacteriales bacterium]
MKKLNFLLAIMASIFALQFSWAQPGEYTVEAGAFYYTPSDLTIEAGSTITWINVGGLHDVNGITNSITDVSFDNPEDFYLGAVYSAGPDSPVEIGSYTFWEEGVYTYDCSIGSHAAQGMVATITVTPQGEYYGCMDETACNFDPVANIEDGSCLYNDVCCSALTPECLACQACQTPEDWCLDNPGYAGCDAYDVVGCMDDGLQDWSPFPNIAADNYEPGANTPGECAYWGCGNPDNTLMLVGTFMNLSGEDGWDGAAMTVTNIWDNSYLYDVGDTVFYFAPTYEVMYELPPLPTEDCCGLINPDEFLADGETVNPDFNPNYLPGENMPDGQVNHDDCLDCPLNGDFVGELGYVVNFCAPDDLLDGCYNLVVDPGSLDIAWEIQNAEISVFALSGSQDFDSTSGAACSDADTFGFSDVKFTSNSVEFDQETGILNFGVTNAGTETTVDSDGIETAGTTWILIDGFAELSDSPEELTGYSPIVEDYVTSNGYFLGTNYEFSYDLSEFTSPTVLGPGNHSITIWLNGGANQPLGVNPEFGEENYENNYYTLVFEIPAIFGCMDPWASNYNAEANTDDDGAEPCYYVCGDTNGDGVLDDDSYESFTITCGGGSWQAEVGWTIQTIDGFEILSGGAPFDSDDFSEAGLCLAPGCYQVIMTDTYGDGWNGNDLEIGEDLEFTIESGSEGSGLFEVGNGCEPYFGCMDDAATNYSETAIVDDGSCEYDCSFFTDENGVSYESVEINIDGGLSFFQGEIGWEIVDSNGDILVSGGAPYSDVTCLPIGCYTLNMTDSFGDGWDDNVMTIESGSGYTWTFTGPEGSYPNANEGTATIATGDPTACGIYFGCMDPDADNYNEANNIEDGSCTYSCDDGGMPVTVECDGGTWQGEVGWTIYDANGFIVLSGGAPYLNEGVCLSEGCYSVIMTDSFGDGWNGNELTIIGLNTVDGIDLEFEASGTGGSGAFGINDESCVTEGCMDDGAENYNPEANMDDGSCEYDCETWLDTEELYSCYWYVWVYNTYDYTVEAMEGYGFDCTCVENPIPGCTDPNADNYDPIADENDGSCNYTCDEDAGQVSTAITCDGGTWQGEVSWQIYDEGGNVVATGGAPYSNEICLMEDMCYSVQMQDSYGDGWNGNILNIGGVEMSLYAGSSGNDTYNCVYECNFEEIAVSVNNGGSDFGFSITNSAGDVVVSGGNDFEGVLCLDPDDCYDVNLASSDGMGNTGATLQIGDNEYGWTGFSFWYAYHYEVIGGGCPIYGCTDPTADNYNPDADVNEASPADSSDPCLYYGCTDPNADNYDSGANYEDATCEYSCDEGLDVYLVNCDGGTYQYEVSWQLIANDGSLAATGGAPTNTGICLAPGCYDVNMSDTYGDGWNGNILTIGDMSFELEEGYEGTSVFVAGVDPADCGVFFGCTDSEAANYDSGATNDDGTCYYNCDQEGWESVIISSTQGFYSYEVAWNIEDADGNILFTAGDVDYAAGGGYDFDNPGLVDTWTCLDLSACYTINMGDAWGDGWNGNTITITTQAGESNDITLFAGNSGSVEYGYCPFICDDTAIDVTVNNGSGTDFAFVVTDYDGNTIVSGGNNFMGQGCFDLENGCYTVSLSSAAGGGQGSASLTIGDDEFNWNDGSDIDYWSSINPESLGNGCPTLGCTDETACNYFADANLDDGSCWYAEDCDNYCVTEDFDSLSDGTSVSTTDLFDTWTGDSTGDVFVSGGEIIVNTGDDIVTTTPVLEEGSYTVSFDMGISEGGSGYFNMGNSGDPSNWQWEFEVYFNDDGTGYTTQSYETWSYEFGTVAVAVLIDLDNGLASLQINGNCVDTWDWSGALGGVNFYGATNDSYSIDNFSLCAGEVEICIPGCTDENAVNYNEDATEDDGSCIDPIYGCTDETAWNYNPVANTDDGGCVSSCSDIGQSSMVVNMYTNGVVSGWYGSSITIGDNEFSLGNLYQEEVVFCADLTGCIDVSAGGGIQQYNIGWSISADGETILEGVPGEGAPFVGEIGSCSVPGCTDSEACNYNSSATDDDGSCSYSDEYYDCDGVCYDDDSDGVCNIDEIDGCTDPTAANYNASATNEDGSCSYAVYGCTDSAASNFNEDANTDDNSCEYGPWGETTTTDCNMTILIPGDASISLEGEAMTEAWIGVTDSDGNICGSVLWTSGETTSIAAWGAEAGEEYGFEAGEIITWIISTEEGNVVGNATFSFGSDSYSCNGLSGITAINFVSTYIQEIELSTGWGIWSTYIDPSDANMASVFEGIVDNLTIVKDESGSVYWPMFGLNSIGELTEGKGYQAKMLADDILVLEGDLVPYDYSLELTEGWGIMGYLHLDCNNAADMMSPVVENLTILKDENGSVYWPMFGLNSIGDMCPGKGYQVKMMETSIFSYPSGGRFGFNEVTIVEKPVYFETAVNTGNNMTIGLPTTAWEVMPAIGDEIAAYDESGSL